MNLVMLIFSVELNIVQSNFWWGSLFKSEKHASACILMPRKGCKTKDSKQYQPLCSWLTLLSTRSRKYYTAVTLQGPDALLIPCVTDHLFFFFFIFTWTLVCHSRIPCAQICVCLPCFGCFPMICKYGEFCRFYMQCFPSAFKLLSTSINVTKLLSPCKLPKPT